MLLLPVTWSQLSIIFSSFLTERQMFSSWDIFGRGPRVTPKQQHICHYQCFTVYFLPISSFLRRIASSHCCPLSPETSAVFVCKADVWFCRAELRPCSKNWRLPVLIQKHSLYNALKQQVFLAYLFINCLFTFTVFYFRTA